MGGVREEDWKKRRGWSTSSEIRRNVEDEEDDHHSVEVKESYHKMREEKS